MAAPAGETLLDRCVHAGSAASRYTSVETVGIATGAGLWTAHLDHPCLGIAWG